MVARIPGGLNIGSEERTHGNAFLIILVFVARLSWRVCVYVCLTTCVQVNTHQHRTVSQKRLIPAVPPTPSRHCMRPLDNRERLRRCVEPTPEEACSDYDPFEKIFELRRDFGFKRPSWKAVSGRPIILITQHV